MYKFNQTAKNFVQLSSFWLPDNKPWLLVFSCQNLLLICKYDLTDRRTAKIVRQMHKRPFYGHALYAIFNTRSQERIVTSFIMSCWEFPCGFLSFFRFTVRLKIVILWASTWGILSNKNLKSWRSAVKRPLVRLSVKATSSSVEF